MALLYVFGMLPLSGLTEQYASDWITPADGLDAELTAENAAVSIALDWFGRPLTDGDTVPTGARLTATVSVRLDHTLQGTTDFFLALPEQITPVSTAWVAHPWGQWQTSGGRLSLELHDDAWTDAPDGLKLDFSCVFELNSPGTLALPGNAPVLTVQNPEYRFTGIGDQQTLSAILEALRIRSGAVQMVLTAPEVTCGIDGSLTADAWFDAAILTVITETHETYRITLRNPEPAEEAPLVFTGPDYTVRVWPSDTANLPENAVLMAEERPETDAYTARAAMKLEIPEADIRFMRVFDLTIMADGEVFEPEGPVRVALSMKTEGDQVTALHFADDPSVPEEAVIRRNPRSVTPTDSGIELLETEFSDEEVSFLTGHFSIYAIVGYTLSRTIETGDGKTYEITMTFMSDAELPDDVALDVRELTDEEREDYLGRTAVLMNAAGFAYSRVFDISLVNGAGEDVQPNAAVQVSVTLLDAENTDDSFTVVHFGEDEPEELSSQTDGNRVRFAADGFSAYAIVQGPDAVPLGWSNVKSISEVKELSALGEGFYIGHTSGYYLKDTLTVDSKRTGITKTKPASTVPPADAAMYYFEPVEGTENQFYIRCENGQYVKNANNNSLSLTSADDKTAFTMTIGADGVMKLNNGAWYWNMQGGANGTRFCSWNSANDVNNNLYAWHYQDVVEDPYHLDGKSYGLMNWNGGVAGKAMMADADGAGTLTASPLIVMTKNDDNEDKLFVPKDSDISMWSFEWIDRDMYYVRCGNAYLQVNGSGLSLVSEPTDACILQVIPGTGARKGQICLKSGSTTLTYNRPASSGESTEEQIGSFGIGGSTGSEWLYLADLSELTSDYFMIYSASKVGVSDERVQDGSRIIVYCRVWNEEAKAYEFYAVDHDGTLKRCYERGDDIQWVGGQLNTMLWNLVEYTDETTGKPNGYFELYNQYSGNFIAPQLTGGQVMSGNTIGINLNGRTNGAYQTTMVAWDDPHYAYACVKADTEQGRIVSIPYVEAGQTPDAVDFLFAIVNELPISDQLHTVPTVDHVQNGITVKLRDFGTRAEMSNFLGNDAGGAVTTLQQGLLSSNLDGSGYPTAVGGSLSSWFANAKEVNHLFIQSTYSGSGYYEYDSTQNFASLHGNDFVVYRELGSYDSGGNKSTLKHGQFFPFNDIEPGVFASVNGSNLYSASAQLLPDSDPRKYEQLYLIKNTNTYFGMEIDASFVQTPNGLDAWGHDIIYQFTGDDDFWLYVDGELIIDLGGIHSAVPGSVNYRTGEVNVNGTHTTLRDLFYKNYIGRGMPPAEAQALIDEKFQQNDQGQWVFKDNTNHTMKIFYLERGAGASNLHMRFNLASVKPGTVELSKELQGVDASESVLAEFAYQIKYTIDGENGETIEQRLTQDTQNPTVIYKGTTTPVTFRDSITIDGVQYDNVFILKPGEKAVIDLNDLITPGDGNDIRYEIMECGINPAVYAGVHIDANGVSTPIVTEHSNGRNDYGTGYSTTKNRPTVAYKNEVDPSALRTLTITKKLFREDGETEITYAEDRTPFSFRLYLGTESEESPSPAKMHTYHVKDAAGDYCRWNVEQQRFESIHKNDYSSLSADEKTAVSFSTSLNGAISKIPATFTVEIRELLAGTQYRVEERPWEIPDGYSFQKYNTDATAQVVEDAGVLGVQDVMVADADAHADICNLRGYGLRVNKVWTDATFMTGRDATYFAVFMDDGQGNLTLVPREDSVKRMAYGDRPQSLYWYYLTLPVSQVPFIRYLIYEVTLSEPDPTVDADGIVSNYGTVTPIGEGQEVQLNGTQKGETAAGSFTYAVHYDRNEPDPDSNVRLDTVTDSRPGIILRKTDWDGQPLQGAVFTLKDADDSLIGTFTSDETGFLTTVFLREGIAYTLTETETPTGYYGLEIPLLLTLTESGAEAHGPNRELYDLSTDPATGITTLTVRNRTCSLQLVKVDDLTSRPLSGIHFSLHRQVTVDGVTAFDINPVPGNDDIVTGSDGILRIADEDGTQWIDVIQALPPGTYQLKEKQSLPVTYKHLPEDVQFTIGTNGTVQVLNTRYQDWLRQNTTNGHTAWALSIRNSLLDPVNIPITGTKILRGRDMAENEFVFLLTPIDVDGNALGEPRYAMNSAAAAGEEGRFTFRLNFTVNDYLDAPYHDSQGRAWFYYDVHEAVAATADETGYNERNSIIYDMNHFLVVVRLWIEEEQLQWEMVTSPYTPGPVPSQYQPGQRQVTARAL